MGGWAWMIVVVVLLAAALLVKLLWPRVSMPYQKRTRLVTKAEMRFFRALQLAVQDDWLIFVMVRVADVLTLPEGTPNRRAWFNRIAAKHVDFVLCDPATLEPRLAIELDDATHQRPDRIERDRFLNEAFHAAGLPLLRIPQSSTYDPSLLRTQITHHL